MRLLASLSDQDQASRFGDYLLTIGIDNSVEEGASGWQVWVKDDDKLEAAQRELGQFSANPSDPRYSAAGRTAQHVRTQQEKRAERLAKNFIDVRTRFSRPGGFPALTMGLIGVCCVVGALTFFGKNIQQVSPLLISAYTVHEYDPHKGEYSEPKNRLQDLSEIRQGQVWRLITPIFVHWGILHLVFNMFWLRDLGSLIEYRKGALWLAVLVLISAVISNVAQYLASGPGAAGMSGVIYALFGYVWMKDRYAPHEGLNLFPHTAFYMLAWLVICFTGMVGPIGNTAHLTGLLIGMAFGIAPHIGRIVR